MNTMRIPSLFSALLILVLLLSVDSLAAQCTTTASRTYLAGLGSTSGLVFTSGGMPTLGSKQQFRIHYNQGLSSVPSYILLLGTKEANITFLGRALLVDPSTIVFQSTGILTQSFFGYERSFSFSIPNDPSLCGLVGVFQAGVLHPGIWSGVHLTNGIKYTIGR